MTAGISSTTRSERAVLGVFLVVAAIAAMMSLTTDALAQGADPSFARALFEEGRALADAGKHAEACVKFEASYRLNPGIGTSFNLADCLEHTGKTASAWTRFLDVAAATEVAGQEKRARAARARADALSPRLARLVIEAPAPAEGMIVERDGVEVAAAAWGTPVPVDPGRHVIRVTAPGKRPWTHEADVPDAPGNVVVSIPPLEEAPATAEPPSTRGREAPRAVRLAPPVAPEEERPSRFTVPVIALGAVSVAALTTTVVFGLNASAKNDEAMGLCRPSACADQDEKSRHDTLVEDAHRDRNVAIVGAAVGAASLLGAAFLVWQGGRGEAENAASSPRRVVALVGPAQARLQVVW